jgi:hypothetical protein
MTLRSLFSIGKDEYINSITIWECFEGKKKEIILEHLVSGPNLQ